LAANLQTKNALGEHLIPGLSPLGVPQELAGTAFPFRYNQLDELKQIITDHGRDLAAIVMEPIRSEYTKEDFLETVRALADESGAVLIIDEVSAGLRLNTGGAHLDFGITQDIVVFSKDLGKGHSIGAIIETTKVMDGAQSTFISSTNWTERVGVAEAIACLNKHIKMNAADCLSHIGKFVQEVWTKAAAKSGLNISVGGIYPLGHFAFEYENALAIKALFV
jgi:glutamate-1-semialdehyde 2,1-aminomutase